MNTHSPSHLAARIAWIVPLLLLFFSGYFTKVTIDLGRTAKDGISAVAEVTRYDRSDRKDITQAELDLRIPLPDGSTLVREKLSLPYSIAHRVEKDTLHVRVLKGSSQEVIISSIVGTQRRIAASNAIMTFIAMLMAFVAVFIWNRSVKKAFDSEPSV
ncbi:MAG: hypothetical protein BMS9Abin05_0356 [Rhodothermia bacterium]|nr:MAG: hypothetical protein BMS9Abin05_0356 [Rhodothermia bacterium]